MKRYDCVIGDILIVFTLILFSYNLDLYKFLTSKRIIEFILMLPFLSYIVDLGLNSKDKKEKKKFIICYILFFVVLGIIELICFVPEK